MSFSQFGDITEYLSEAIDINMIKEQSHPCLLYFIKTKKLCSELFTLFRLVREGHLGALWFPSVRVNEMSCCLYREFFLQINSGLLFYLECLWSMNVCLAFESKHSLVFCIFIENFPIFLAIDQCFSDSIRLSFSRIRFTGEG